MSLTQSEAYEFLGAEIGEALALNGVHGTQITKIAEKLRQAQLDARAGIKALEVLGGAKALDLTPDSILILTDPSGDVDEHTLQRVRELLKVKALLMLPDEAEIELVGEEKLQQLCLALMKAFPQIGKGVREHLGIPAERLAIAEKAWDAGYGAGVDHEDDADLHPTREEFLKTI